MGIIEIAQACALSLVAPLERNPLLATTRGVGELIMAAYSAGCRRFIVGLGGSATCDGGAGMLSVPGIKEVLATCHFELLCDVTAPYTGHQGAARMFAPQKGASPEDVEVLEKLLEQLALQIAKETGTDVSSRPGAGAAGGLGGALMAYADASIYSGIERIMDLVNLDEALHGAALVLTGEGRSDIQTLSGKVPFGVLRRSAHIPVILVSGSVDRNCRTLMEAGYKDIIDVSNPENIEEDIKPQNAKANIITAVGRILASRIA